MVLCLGSRGDSRSGKRDGITLLRRTGKLVNFFGTPLRRLAGCGIINRIRGAYAPNGGTPPERNPVQAGGAKMRKRNAKDRPGGKKRSKVWRVVTTILIVLAALLLLAAAVIGTYIGLKMKKFNDRNQGLIDRPPVERPESYSRPETQESIVDIEFPTDFDPNKEYTFPPDETTAGEPTDAPTEREEPTGKPEEPTSKPEEPTSKPEEPTSKPENPTTRPEDPTGKPTEPTTTRPPEPDTEPEPIKNGIVKENGKLFYYENGKKVGAGLIRLDGNYYYVKPSGDVVRNTTYYIEDGKNMIPPGYYVFNAQGAVVRRAGNEQSLNSFHNSTDEVDVFGNVPIYRETQRDPNIRNILVLGTDSRDVSKERGNSDVMIVLSINKKTKEVRMISVLRDVLVPIEGHDWNRINAAYRLEGAGLAVNTVNEAFGLDIQEFIVVDFNGVIELIDHIGGIDITLTAAEAQYYSNKHSVLFGNNLSAGSIHMNGDQALAHLRNRTLGTDFERTRRQRDVMIAMLNQVLGQSLTQMDSTLDFVLDIIRTNIKATDFLSVGLSIVTNFSSGVKSMSVPNRSQQGKEYRFASYKGMSILKLLDPNDPTKQMDLTYTERKVREFLYD